MRDKVLTASRDLSCLMCITPWEGGGWFSPISYLQYRNYAYEPLNNKAFADAALAVGLGAYTLEIQFRILPDNTYGALFDYTGMTGLPKVYINSATRTLYAQNRDGSKSYTFSGFEYGVWYTFKITRLSLALVTTFSVTETSQSTTLADLSLATPATTASDYYISSSFSGNIRSLTFSGPTNYAFSVYEIYSNYGIALPSTTPRNFATETASWRDFVAIYNEQFVLGHSYRLICRLRLAAAPAQNLSVFGGNIPNPLSLAVNASRNLNCTSRLLRTSSVEYVTIGSSQALTVGQWYDVSVFFRNNQMVLKIDQAEYLSSAGKLFIIWNPLTRIFRKEIPPPRKGRSLIRKAHLDFLQHRNSGSLAL